VPWVHLDSDRGLLSPTDGNQSDTCQLRDLLRQSGIRKVFHFGQWQRVRGHASVIIGASAGFTLL